MASNAGSKEAPAAPRKSLRGSSTAALQLPSYERPGTQGGGSSSSATTSNSLSLGSFNSADSKRPESRQSGSGASSATQSQEIQDSQEIDEATAALLAFEREVKTRKRMETSYYLTDWVLNVTPLLSACREALDPHSQDLQYLTEAVWNACRNMSTLQWELFCDHVLTKVHRDDREVFTSFFAHVEPGWRQTLTSPKELGPGICNFLYLGTVGMSQELCEVLTRLGWAGVVVGPVGLSNEEYREMKFVKINVFDEAGVNAMRELWTPKGGLVPRPRTFQLVIVDLVFHTDEEERALQEEGVEEDEDVMGARRQQELRIEALQEESRFGSILSPGRHPMNFGAKEDIPEAASGYGKLGVTRTDRARHRLQAIHLMLTTALQRLHNGGSLVITWPGLPFHPTLFFIMVSLRPLFQRVHVISPPGLKTFEMYILAQQFKREAIEATSSSGDNAGQAFNNFLVHSPYRRNGLDDVLLWTLTDAALLDEYRLTTQVRGRSHGYDELFKTYGDKVYALAQEIIKGKVRVGHGGHAKSAEKGKEALQAQQPSGSKERSKFSSSVTTSFADSGGPSAGSREAKAKAKAAAKQQATKRRKKKTQKSGNNEDSRFSFGMDDDSEDEEPVDDNGVQTFERLAKEEQDNKTFGEQMIRKASTPPESRARPKAGSKRQAAAAKPTGASRAPAASKTVDDLFKRDTAGGLPSTTTASGFLRSGDQPIVPGPGRALRKLQSKSQPQLACTLLGAAPGLRGRADPHTLGVTWPAVLDAFQFMEQGGTKSYFLRKGYERKFGQPAEVDSPPRGSTSTSKPPGTAESDAFRDMLIPAALRKKTPP